MSKLMLILPNLCDVCCIDFLIRNSLSLARYHLSAILLAAYCDLECQKSRENFCSFKNCLINRKNEHLDNISLHD